ncbi:site-2 protease family protein [Dictyobacter formicarum]|uniref:Peptidase M50 domain-containing protein n=1 Tax=Dictyobacter formicarum TaxID=2778368 RepID=A0ABQ3VST0_9CHLR|nr:site-2 protease family protein [Dictyobacter formicarum]GHO88376.1 hypothetical protein KSZ_63820 [Dictyobacter formicarum]
MIDVILSLMIILSFLGAIILHEWAHAQMASWLGDHSSGTLERKSLRLGLHIDPVGTLMCVILAFQSFSGLGWGRPVKPDPWKMKVGANTGVLLVACAGPIFSLIVGLAIAALMRLLIPITDGNIALNFVMKLLSVFATVNVSLAIFNIIPLYPLDGYQIVYTLLPSKQAVQFSRSAAYGPFIILIVFFFLPFLAQFSGLGDFPLFRLAFYIQLAAMILTSLAAGMPLDGYYYYGHLIFH